MKRCFRIWIAVLMVLMAVGLAAQEPDPWREGRDLYGEGRYQEALERFRSLLPRYDNWKIHYNIGNCLFKLQQTLEAKLAYARAWKTAPGNPSVRRNLQVVNARLGFEDELLKQSFLERVLAGVDRIVPLNLSALMLVLSLLLLNVSVFFWMRRRLVRPARYLFLISLVLAVFFGIHTAYAKESLTRSDLAVVQEAGVSVYSGPGEHHTALFSLPGGLIVRIREEGANWMRVTAGKEVSGWIRPEWLIRL